MGALNRYYTVAKSPTVPAVVLGAANQSGNIDLGAEYCFFKIACPDASEVVVGQTLYLLAVDSQGQADSAIAHGNEAFLNFVMPAGEDGFIWEVATLVGYRHLRLAWDGVLSGDVNFYITGYERVE